MAEGLIFRTRRASRGTAFRPLESLAAGKETGLPRLCLRHAAHVQYPRPAARCDGHVGGRGLGNSEKMAATQYQHLALFGDHMVETMQKATEGVIYQAASRAVSRQGIRPTVGVPLYEGRQLVGLNADGTTDLEGVDLAVLAQFEATRRLRPDAEPRQRWPTEHQQPQAAGRPASPTWRGPRPSFTPPSCRHSPDEDSRGIRL